ncbi:MAG TPA: HAMP domain-containing sensor histidine kinase [Thermomonas sp.]|nr:HAMP domain-containing sensor histidine kinase [Thermomonas sp.]
MAESATPQVDKTQRNIREIFLLQLAIVCLVVVVCVLGVQAMYGASALSWLSVVAIAIGLLAVAIVSWLGYRATRRAVAPMDWLVRVVARWDPQHPDTDALAPVNLPDEVQGDVRKMAEALHALGQRLETYVARERDFTRDASHELRTPLTVIRVATDLIGHDDGLSARSRRSLTRIQDATESMESLMSALLLLARDSDVPLEIEDFDVREVVEHEIDKVRPALEDKGVALVLDVQAQPILHAPPRVLQVILFNLLSNAARFTDAGTVHVRLLQDRVEIEDTGIGMDAAALARAFEPFYRASIEQPVGSGLGLSIAQRLGQRCGWPLQLTSAPGQGTRACILFGAVNRDQ